MVKYHAPKRGSLAFRRKRAKRIYPHVSTWPDVVQVRLLGYPAYKVGMISVYEKNVLVSERAMWYGLERVVAATVLEAPPIRIIGMRFYGVDGYDLKTIDEIWCPNFGKFERRYLQRKFPLPKKSYEEAKKILEEKTAKIQELIDKGEIREIRAIVRTCPELTTIGKKKPEVLEIKVSGEIKEAYEWCNQHLGKFIRIRDVFEPGMFIDVIGVTKGKGFQGVVKRFGVKLLPPKSKKGYRRLGTLGPWTPGRIMWTVPRPGQLGYFRRTEYNKQILTLVPSEYEFKYGKSKEEEPYTIMIKDKIVIKKKEGEEEKQVTLDNIAQKLNPKGGWPHYGIIKNDAIILRGSCQGPPKRMVILRWPVRAGKLKTDVDLRAIYYGREKIFDKDVIESIFEVLQYSGDEK